MRQLPPLGIFAIARDINEGGVAKAGKHAVASGAHAVGTVVNLGTNLLQTALYADPTGRGIPGSYQQMPGRGMSNLLAREAYRRIPRVTLQQRPQPEAAETNDRGHGG